METVEISGSSECGRGRMSKVTRPPVVNPFCGLEFA